MEGGEATIARTRFAYRNLAFAGVFGAPTLESPLLLRFNARILPATDRN